MTEVAFHFNAPDRIAYACRLLRKAVSSGAKLVVVGAPDTLQQLDAALWTFSSTDFVPHCYIDSDPSVLAASPVVLTTSALSAPHQQVLINLGQVVPEGYDRFDRVIEVVALDDEGRQLARGRWKHYTERGCTITRHDLNLNNS